MTGREQIFARTDALLARANAILNDFDRLIAENQRVLDALSRAPESRPETRVFVDDPADAPVGGAA